MGAMAKRINGAHEKDIREKIKASQLVNRLQDNALAEKEFLSAGQIKSIETLLDRVIPKLQSVKHEGGGENGEFQIVIRRFSEQA
jgi:hypothetical protein